MPGPRRYPTLTTQELLEYAAVLQTARSEGPWSRRILGESPQGMGTGTGFLPPGGCAWRLQLGAEGREGEGERRGHAVKGLPPEGQKAQHALGWEAGGKGKCERGVGNVGVREAQQHGASGRAGMIYERVRG